MRYERRSVVSRELRFWQRQGERANIGACVIMVVILIVGLCAVWSV